MTRTPRDVPEAELAVLELLWRDGPATRRQVADVLYPGGGPSQYATVQKLLERLQQKGSVGRRGGGAFLPRDRSCSRGSGGRAGAGVAGVVRGDSATRPLRLALTARRGMARGNPAGLANGLGAASAAVAHPRRGAARRRG